MLVLVFDTSSLQSEVLVLYWFLYLLNNGGGGGGNDAYDIVLFNHGFNFFVVLACYGRLYVFTNHILLALSWNKVLVVYASQGIDI